MTDISHSLYEAWVSSFYAYIQYMEVHHPYRMYLRYITLFMFLTYFFGCIINVLSVIWASYSHYYREPSKKWLTKEELRELEDEPEDESEDEPETVHDYIHIKFDAGCKEYMVNTYGYRPYMTNGICDRIYDLASFIQLMLDLSTLSPSWMCLNVDGHPMIYYYIPDDDITKEEKEEEQMEDQMEEQMEDNHQAIQRLMMKLYETERIRRLIA
jgi:hypothetical protein